jgi:chemotaxis protein methyltransferase CheR
VNPGALALTPHERSQFLDLVDHEFGIRGSEYGASRLDDAVNAVLPQSGYASSGDLLASFVAGTQPRWLYRLVEYLTVGETYFFRDPAQITALRATILPDLVRQRSSDRRLRVWSAGCSTGEETYTLAILLREMPAISDWDVQLVGTDVNRDSLRQARDARYAAWSFRATPDSLRAQYFEPVVGDTGWRLIEPIRRMARFMWMNLGAERIMPPSAKLDLVVCRNVTIYFDDAATQRLYRALVAALAPGGWLMLGPSDPLPTDRQCLERVDMADAVVWRRVQPRVVPPAPRPSLPTRTVRAEPRPPSMVIPAGNGRHELEAGLLALECGRVSEAVDGLRRATFRDPRSAVAQFALARAYLEVGDQARAHAALVQTRRLLATLPADGLVPESDAVPVEALRQAVQTHLEALAVE